MNLKLKRIAYFSKSKTFTTYKINGLMLITKAWKRSNLKKKIVKDKTKILYSIIHSRRVTTLHE